MYTRYIPQPDGSYRRSRVPDPIPQRPSPPPRQEYAKECPPEKPPCREEPPCRPESKSQEPPRHCPAPRPGCQGAYHRLQKRPCQEQQEPCKDRNVGDFLRKLLPKDFDTGDLLIVLLLLLMSGDCDGDQNTALLTLVLYLFL